jgi:hypothetical protein
MTEATCKKLIPDGGRAVTFHACGRKLSGSDDYPELCGLHASAKRRSLAKDAARRSSAARRVAEVAAANAKVIDLNNRLGIVAVAQTTFPTSGIDAYHQTPTGNAVVPIDQLASLADRLAELEQENLRRRLGEY